METVEQRLYWALTDFMADRSESLSVGPLDNLSIPTPEGGSYLVPMLHLKEKSS